MTENFIMKKMGFKPDDRVLIIHADDIGMCQSTLPAFENLVDFGLVKSGALMAPCSWFPAAAELARIHPEWDLGVHITLNCEWEGYRWGPLSTRDPVSGLLDEAGYLWRSAEATQEHCDPVAASAEMEAQVVACEKMGVDVTHIDTHMGTVLHPKLLHSYAQCALSRRLPLLAVRLDVAGWMQQGADAESAELAVQFGKNLEELGSPLHDGMFWAPLDKADDRIDQYMKLIERVPNGLSRIYIHPAEDTPELRAICPDWRARVEDYRTFMQPGMKEFIANQGIHLVDYREVKNAMIA